MFEASHYYVQMDEMMAAVGKEIATVMGAPGAIVTCGCEAAIAVATACICTSALVPSCILEPPEAATQTMGRRST